MASNNGNGSIPRWLVTAGISAFILSVSVSWGLLLNHSASVHTGAVTREEYTEMIRDLKSEILILRQDVKELLRRSGDDK
jgi:hypothetical protein